MSSREYYAWMAHASEHPLAGQMRSGVMRALTGSGDGRGGGRPMLRGKAMIAALDMMGRSADGV